MENDYNGRFPERRYIGACDGNHGNFNYSSFTAAAAATTTTTTTTATTTTTTTTATTATITTKQQDVQRSLIGYS